MLCAHVGGLTVAGARRRCWVLRGGGGERAAAGALRGRVEAERSRAARGGANVPRGLFLCLFVCRASLLVSPVCLFLKAAFVGACARGGRQRHA